MLELCKVCSFSLTSLMRCSPSPLASGLVLLSACLALLYNTLFSHCTAGHCKFLLRGINKGLSYLIFLLEHLLNNFDAMKLPLSRTLFSPLKSPVALWNGVKIDRQLVTLVYSSDVNTRMSLTKPSKAAPTGSLLLPFVVNDVTAPKSYMPRYASLNTSWITQHTLRNIGVPTLPLP